MRLSQIFRRLIQLPVFTAVAVLTLAIGIGANAAIFSVIEGVLLKPLPYPNADELIVLDHTAAGLNIKSAGSAPFLYFTYREDGRVFQDVAMWTGDTVSVTGLAEPEEVRAVDVTDGLLPMLGAIPSLGRLFTKQDDSPGAADTVILMACYWRSRFGADPSAVGRRILLDGKAREIIGVLPESFRFLDQKPSMILPLQFDRAQTHLGNFSYAGVARLKPGATLDQATADVTRLIPVALGRFPAFPGFSRVDRKSTRLNSSHTEIYTLSLHDALPICEAEAWRDPRSGHGRRHATDPRGARPLPGIPWFQSRRSEEHTSELQSHRDLHSFPTRRSSDLRG